MSTQILTDDTPVDPDDEQLVAYLDGELGPQDRDALEHRLINDADLRTRLHDLQRGWDMLDDLPDVTPNEKLVETTMEMVVTDVMRAGGKKPAWYQRVPIAVFVALGCLLTATMGYAAVQWRRTAMLNRQLDDLTIVEDLDAYLDGDDLNLMRQLAGMDAWQDVIIKLKEIQAIEPIDTGLSELSTEQRKAALAELPGPVAGHLAANWDSFRNFDRSRQESLREFADTVALQTDAQRLLQTMRDYSLWKATLPPSQIDAIESPEVSDPGDAVEIESKRRDAIDEAIAYSNQRIQRQSAWMLNEETVDILNTGLSIILEERLSDPESATSLYRDRRLQADDLPPFVREHIDRILLWEIVSDAPPGFERNDGAPKLTDQEFEMLEFWIPTKDAENLDILAGDDPMLRASVLLLWAESALRRSMDDGRSTPLQRYQMMSDYQRMRLDLSEPEKIQEEISRTQRRRSFGGGRRGSGGGGGPGRGGPMPPPPPKDEQRDSID
ncbi:hypothetical protein V7x_28250 [Crateriforma conspicua]|uniref:Zinc-finger domain-containing protein n=1 Tax=Crateriforma conspicua TaxID=2527996 RepID=A0A5C6FVV5_9PLAN|nr:hypothetical protein [Crateriforma conspicua]TWU67252.1 hypothetical protein V7x_28250 [Crateriforma conspicua]